MTLKKRVDSLEERLAVDSELKSIFIEIMRAGDDGGVTYAPVKGYRYQDCEPTYRQEGESDEQLQARAISEAEPFVPLAKDGFARPVAVFSPLLQEDDDV